MQERGDQEQDKRQGGDAAIPAGQNVSRDSATTRRALLTGGAVVAGAAVATLATTEQAAAANVVLGAINDERTPTVFRSTGNRAVTGTVSAAGAIALVGTSSGAGGSGVYGAANASSNSSGVFGVSSRGAGVRGESSLGTGVVGVSSGSNTIGVSGKSPTGSSAMGVKGETVTGIGVFGVATGNGYGVRGNGGYNGVYGSGGSYGVIGSAGGGYGVYGSGSTGVYASGGSGGYGLQAYGGTYGVYASGASYGVYAQGATAVYGSSGSGSGIYGVSSEVNSPAVFGTGGQYGVMGANGRTAGVRGDSNYVGVWGEGREWGFFSIATGTSGQNYGFMSETRSPAGYAGWFKGNVRVEGTVTKNAGSFMIDHPLDPERKWLSHSFVESPDMMNVYNGNVTTDASGLAIVKLPAYFTALNRDFRYQLTVIGTFAQAIVDREIQKNQFRIRTDKGRVKVSWQVTGIRQDDYAKAHPIIVEVAKKGSEVGTRQFVPKGSSARKMNVGPRRPKSGPVSLPAAPPPPPPPRQP